MKQLSEIIHFWEARRAQPLALATLVAASGSSYRRPGARMLIDRAGDFAGGVSAGCIEEEVIACAFQVLNDGKPQLMKFDTRLRFGCHGMIEIFVEPVAGGLMADLRDSMLQRQTCLLETVVEGDRPGTQIEACQCVEASFLQTIEPILRLILIGDGSDTVALRAQADLLGWNVLQLEAPPIPRHLIDDHTAVVLASHHYGRDCTALRSLLPLGLRYLGVIGSRRRREDLLFDVLQSGVAMKSSLFAPAGLHLEGETPEEIALSIVAEIQCVFAAGTGQQLRHRNAPIHHPNPEGLACAESAA